jgi:hypothetical protein
MIFLLCLTYFSINAETKKGWNSKIDSSHWATTAHRQPKPRWHCQNKTIWRMRLILYIHQTWHPLTLTSLVISNEFSSENLLRIKKRPSRYFDWCCVPLKNQPWPVFLEWMIHLSKCIDMNDEHCESTKRNTRVEFNFTRSVLGCYRGSETSNHCFSFEFAISHLGNHILRKDIIIIVV